MLKEKYLGNQAYAAGKLREAIMAYSRAITIATDRPHTVEDYNNVVSALYDSVCVHTQNDRCLTHILYPQIRQPSCSLLAALWQQEAQQSGPQA